MSGHQSAFALGQKRKLSRLVETISDMQGITEFVELEEPLSNESLSSKTQHIEAVSGDYRESEHDNFAAIATPIALEAHFHLIDIQMLSANAVPPFTIARTIADSGEESFDLQYTGYPQTEVPDSVFCLSIDRVVSRLVECAHEAGLDQTKVSTNWLLRAEKALRSMPVRNQPQPTPAPGLGI